MAHNNLALLDRVVQGTIALELGDSEYDDVALAELGIAPQRTRTVAGLTIISNAARDADIDPKAAKRLERLFRFRADRFLVTEKLKRVGVTPVAVTPHLVWERICDHYNLYRFCPHGDTVRVKEDILDKAGKDANYHWRHPPFGPGMKNFMGSALQKRIDELEKKGELFNTLWPGCREPAKGLRIRIVLPEAPQSVQERLVAVERTNLLLHIALEHGAIDFGGPLADMLIDAVNQRLRELERQRREEARVRDPIIYVVEGTAVAIIDQYGEFPIEKEVSNKVVNSENLI